MSKLSVLCSTYNHNEHQLRVFIHCMLAQSFKDFTCYILQDGPDPNNIAKKVCKDVDDPRIIYDESAVREGKWGFPNRNRVLKKVDSKYVAFQSADNYVCPLGYETLVLVAEANDLDVLMCKLVHNYPNINSWTPQGKKEIYTPEPPYSVLDTTFDLNRVDISNYIIKTELAKGVGGFDTDLPDKIQNGADGFFAEKIKKKYGKNLKIMRHNSILMVHN